MSVGEDALARPTSRRPIDPDGNGLELAWDRPREQWPRAADGTIGLDKDGPVDLDALLEHAPH
jgi:catechol-2,3-dioxygenase